jgi:diguanylate cyclase (GGDEF)-like protein/PAS domain S-box-containing protein
MKDPSRTNQELLEENSVLNQRIRELELSDSERKRVEQTLWESEREIKALFKSMINAFVLFKSVFDDDGNFVSYRFVYINDAYERITGVKNDEVRGKTVHEVWPGTETSWVKAYGDVAMTGVPTSFDMYHEPTGKFYYCNVYRPWDTKDRFCVVFEDITERRQAEKVLRESEERYRTLVENASDIIFRTDNTGHFTFVNSSALRITGYEEAEVIGTHYPALIRLDMRDEAIKFFGRQLVKGLNNTYSEYPIIAKDGHEVWLGQNTQLIVEDGNITGFQSVARDITDRKRTEDALNAAEETYRNIFMNSQIGLFRTDIKTGMMLEANDSMAKFAGYKNRDELLSSKFNIAERYIDPEDREKIIALVKKQGQADNYETQFRRNDGSIIWIRLSAKIIPDKGWLEGVAEDITKEKNARESLQISEERYKSLVENANEAILVIQDGMIKFLNNRAVASFGYSEQELMFINIFELIHPEDRDLVMERYLQKINGDKTSTRQTYRTINKSGQTQWVEISSVLIDWEGNPATLNLITDITERKQMEKALRESEERYRELSIVDDLTQLYNSRHFYFQLKIELDRSSRYEQPLTLLLLDLDNFKAFNDTYGHVEGDHVLRQLGQVVKRCLRETDFAYRYGGEEFTILLPMTTSADGSVTAERIRAELKKETFSPVPGQEVHMTVSIGLAQYKPKEDMKAFVHRVDQLMYQGKKNGKDRVCSEL